MSDNDPLRDIQSLPPSAIAELYRRAAWLLPEDLQSPRMPSGCSPNREGIPTTPPKDGGLLQMMTLQSSPLAAHSPESVQSGLLVPSPEEPPAPVDLQEPAEPDSERLRPAIHPAIGPRGRDATTPHSLHSRCVALPPAGSHYPLFLGADITCPQPTLFGPGHHVGGSLPIATNITNLPRGGYLLRGLRHPLPFGSYHPVTLTPIPWPQTRHPSSPRDDPLPPLHAATLINPPTAPVRTPRGPNTATCRLTRPVLVLNIGGRSTSSCPGPRRRRPPHPHPGVDRRRWSGGEAQPSPAAPIPGTAPGFEPHTHPTMLALSSTASSPPKQPDSGAGGTPLDSPPSTPTSATSPPALSPPRSSRRHTLAAPLVLPGDGELPQDVCGSPPGGTSASSSRVAFTPPVSPTASMSTVISSASRLTQMTSPAAFGGPAGRPPAAHTPGSRIPVPRGSTLLAHRSRTPELMAIPPHRGAPVNVPAGGTGGVMPPPPPPPGPVAVAQTAPLPTGQQRCVPSAHTSRTRGIVIAHLHATPATTTTHTANHSSRTATHIFHPPIVRTATITHTHTANPPSSTAIRPQLALIPECRRRPA
ncbi:hypothetical protein PAPYR_5173 [Paratrimastix pyriformis]|uniref:Uncharacterized protein n=1 Tax=Paratrimastix pyriformis TaxID=342808 RepID=A0ABQ8UKF2_9EUKA|nr:hypothetical protein PAPYR_5173 [Paratrimastix pyriformis]